MIYHTDDERGKVHQALDWKLFSAAGESIPLKSEGELRAYLKGHPNTEFDLRPGVGFNREILDAEADNFDPHSEHIRCGWVRYDSRTGKVITK
jgi:hypothetical protein